MYLRPKMRREQMSSPGFGVQVGVLDKCCATVAVSAGYSGSKKTENF